MSIQTNRQKSKKVHISEGACKNLSRFILYIYFISLNLRRFCFLPCVCALSSLHGSLCQYWKVFLSGTLGTSVMTKPKHLKRSRNGRFDKELQQKFKRIQRKLDKLLLVLEPLIDQTVSYSNLLLPAKTALLHEVVLST